MFNNEDEFKNLVDRLNIDDRSCASHKEKLRTRMLTTFNAARQKDPEKTTSKQTFWRTIMKSTITKLATAAAVIIAVLFGLHHFGGSIDGTSVTWAQVVEQLSSHERYKCRQRIVRQGRQVSSMTVYHLSLSQRRQEAEDGSVHVIDMRGEDAITVELYPDKKKAIVTKLIGTGPRKDPDIINMVKRFDQVSTERLGTKKQDGKTLYGFRHQLNKFNDFTIWVDSQTKLPVEVELKHLRDGQIRQTIFMDEFEFDFDLDPSAFSTAVPDGYKVETIIDDYRPREPKEVTDNDVRSGLNHIAYAIKQLSWAKKVSTIEISDPLGTKAIVYMTGLQSSDENLIILVQGNYYDMTRMVWIPQQQLVLEVPAGIKLYTHPNGSIYAKEFLESFAKAKPEFFDIKNLSDQRFTRMIVMPNGTVLGLSANKPMTHEHLKELVGSLTEIAPNS